MTIHQITEWFGWMTVVNIGLHAFAALFVLFAQDRMTDMHERMFSMGRTDLRRAYFACLAC